MPFSSRRPGRAPSGGPAGPPPAVPIDAAEAAPGPVAEPDPGPGPVPGLAVRAPVPPRPGAALRRRAGLGLLAVAALVAAGLPAPRALGLGDRLFPTLGNPGYDVTAYDIALNYPGRNDRPMDAVTTITARPAERLDRINLDFARGTVRSVRVGGRPARYVRRGDDLIVTPEHPVPAGFPLRVVVRHTSDPRGQGGGWIRTADGLAMANQADAAHEVFPCNDHPSDKARFTFRVTAPRNLRVVANGERVTSRAVPPAAYGTDPSPAPGPRAGTTTWTYRTEHPMATELAQVSIGRSAVVRGTGPAGLPLRHVVPAADRKRLAKWLDATPGQLAWMEKKVGRYPFETYGVLIAKASTGYELETQTLSLFEGSLFTSSYPDWYVRSIMVHELAHQWFGDSVSPRTWSDVWLNEAHATWYEALYAQEQGKVSMAERMRRAYQWSDDWRAGGGPPGAPKVPGKGDKIGIFRPVIYDGSALVLYALREKIGARDFDRLERHWVARHRDGVAGTDDFVALASQVSGQNLTGFFRDWLHAAKTPPMPGHPDWKPGAPKPAKPGAEPARGQ
ncbi:M1 family metallopeptidase [Streptomyces sp. NPDC003077]|uniref:M1 family metallopeptidase n=1 Tax=Streptomyces sp. NPDC003077 TaxID=3154443 RepID=UPI0033B73766